MKKFLFRLSFSSNKLNVIHEQIINITIFFSELRHTVIPDGTDQLIEKLFCRDVHRIHFRIQGECVDTNGIEKVRFSQSDTSVDKKGIIIFSGLFRNSHSRRVGELIACPDDKPLKIIILLKGRMDPETGRFFGNRCRFFKNMRFCRGMTTVFTDEKINDQCNPGNSRESIGNDGAIIFHQPIFEKLIRNGQMNLISFQRSHLDRSDPGFKVLMA